MVDPLASGELPLGGMNVLEKFSLLDQPLIFVDVEEYGCAPAMLGEDERTAGGTHLLDEGGSVGPELGERADILAEARADHGYAPDFGTITRTK
jgi:hypothetical protein